MCIEDTRPVKLKVYASSDNDNSSWFKFRLDGKVFPDNYVNEGWVRYADVCNLEELKEKVLFYKGVSNLPKDKIVVRQFKDKSFSPKGIFNKENMKKLQKYLVSESEPLPKFNLS